MTTRYELNHSQWYSGRDDRSCGDYVTHDEDDHTRGTTAVTTDHAAITSHVMKTTTHSGTVAQTTDHAANMSHTMKTTTHSGTTAVTTDHAAITSHVMKTTTQWYDGSHDR